MNRFAIPGGKPGAWPASTLAFAAFAVCVLAIALLPVSGSVGNVGNVGDMGVASHHELVVYALSFWHYYLYWLAWRHGRVPLAVFRRDAVLMKSLALMALGMAYFAAPIDWLSLAVVAAGFALNAAAARALGTDRTYYGHELANLPHRHITAFPYGWVSHPMLLGNTAAYAGTLLNADFRAQWWPLAALHVALNLGLLVMETRVAPLRGRREPTFERTSVARSATRSLMTLSAALAAGALAGAAGNAWLAGAGAPLPAIAVGALAGVNAIVIFRWYSSPATQPSQSERPDLGDQGDRT